MNSNKFLLLLLFLVLSKGVLAQGNPLDPSTWMVSPPAFSEEMTITGVIEINTTEITSENYTIAAFVNGECRGVAKPVYTAGVDRYVVTLFVYSNGGGMEEVTFFVHDETNNLVLPVTASLTFDGSVPIGTLVDPYIFETLQTTITFEKDDVLCAADDHGYAKASISFGNPNLDYDYTLKWSSGSTDERIDNLSAGIYYLTVTVENAFNFVDSVEIVNLNRPIQKPTLLAAPSDEICNGDNAFVLAYTNETEDPSYYWFNIFNKPIDTTDVLTVLNLTADRLLYAQTAVRNCLSELSSISLEVFDVPNANFSVLLPVASIGETINFAASEPQRPNTIYRWDFGDGVVFNYAGTTVKHVYDSEGTYRVTLSITTAQGCVREQTRLVTILKPTPPDDTDPTPPDPLLFSFNINDALCSNDRSGSIAVQVFNGTAPIRYNWSNGSTGSSIKDLLPGTYTVTITDASGKRGVGTATVISKYSNNIQPPTVIVNGGRTVCESNDAWVAAVLNYPEAEVLWYDSPTGGAPLFQGNPFVLFNMQQNTVLYVETRVGSCASERVRVNVGVRQLSSEFDASATIAPPGLAINFASIGADLSQNYLWEFGDGTTATGISTSHIFRNPGIYEVKLTASLSNGCSETSSKTIRITEQSDLGVAFNIKNVLCAEDTDGSISVEIATGTPPYNIQWSNGETSSLITGLGVGTYTVTITDQRGATRTQSVSVTSENPPIDIPDISINGGDVVCAGESVILAALTNVADAEYRWYDAPTGGNLLYNGASYPLNDIQENQEVFVEAFFNGCFSQGRSTTLVRVTGPDATFTASSKTVNEEGTINFNANVVVNSNAYTWDFGDGTSASGTSAQKSFESTGLYTVTLTVTDSVGCTASTAQVIRVVSAAQMTINFAIKNVTCANDQNGAITATVFNGKPPFNFQWENGTTSNSLNNLRAGTYKLTVTDADGQSLAEVVEVVPEVGVLQPPTIVLAGDSFVCPNEFVIAYAYNSQQGNFSYHWYDAPVGGNLLAVTNAFNAYGRDLPEQLFVETRVGNCKSEARKSVSIQTESPNLGFTVTNTTVIEGNQINFIPNVIDSTYTYSWFFNDGSVSNLMTPTHSFAFPGTYRVRLDVTSANGCQDSKFLTVNVIAENETALLLKPTTPSCEGSSNGKIVAEVVNGQAPYTFVWSNGATTSFLENLTAGIYSVTLTDANGSNITKSITLEPGAPKPQAPTISLNANDPVCFKDDVVLTGNSPEQVDRYFWYDDDNNLLSIQSSLAINDIESSGTFYLETQKNGCVSDRVNLALSVQIPDASFSVSQNGLTSLNESLAFVPTVTTHSVYTWNFGDGNNSTQLNPQHIYATAGTFDVTLTVRDADGCTNTSVREDLVNVLSSGVLKLELKVDDILCATDNGGRITVVPGAGTAPYTFQWSNGATSAVADELPEGTYSVTVTDAQGQFSIGTATIQKRNLQILPPVVTINGNAPVCKGSDAFLLSRNPQFADASTLWFDADGAQAPIATSELLVLRNVENRKILYVQSQIEGCISQRIPIEVNVQAPLADFRITPSPEVMEGDIVQFRLMQMNQNYSYYWEFGDNGWSTLPEPYYFYNLGGEFDVKLTVIDPDGCENTIQKERFVTVNLLPSSGLKPEESVEERSKQAGSKAKDNIQAAFFPNPFQQDLNVLLKAQTTGSYGIEVTDLLGRSYFAQEIELTANVPQPLQLQAGQWNNGMYLLHVKDANTKTIYKILKQGL